MKICNSVLGILGVWLVGVDASGDAINAEALDRPVKSKETSKTAGPVIDIDKEMNLLENGGQKARISNDIYIGDMFRNGG
jgi:hypothetical protein